MIRSRLRQAKRGSSGFNFPGAPFPVSFAYDFLSSANPVIGGGTTATVIDADGTYINSAGIITQKTANVWPLDYDPATLQPLGRPVWEGRTNLLLNSLLNGANLSTQSVTLTAVAHTLSFYGTGTVTLSGASTAGPLVGSGAYPNRVSLTFTPSAGSVTFTVTGTVQFAQLEIGSFATSFIPTAGAAVARAADNLSLLLGIWFNATEGAWLVEFIPGAPSTTTASQVFIVVSNGTVGEIYSYYRNGLTGNTGVFVADGGATQVNITNAGVTTTNAISKVATAYRVNDFSCSVNGAVPATDGTATLPTPITLYLGSTNNTSGYLNGWLRKLYYSPIRQPDGILQRASR